MTRSPEGLHDVGRDFLIKTKQYLEATLVIDVPWTVYHDNGMTVLQGLDGKAHAFDALGMLKDGAKRPIYIEAKFRTKSSDINSEYDDFVAESFSCYVKEQWRPNFDPYFMFVTNRPFKTEDYHKLTQTAYLASFLSNLKGKYGVNQATSDQVEAFKDRLWLVIWSNRQDLMCVSDPSLYKRMAMEGRSLA